MSSSALTVYPQLPPTTNTLDLQQRTRLMRSTRKLGAVLGASPYLLENDSPFTVLPLGETTSRALKRQGSIFTHHKVSQSTNTLPPIPAASSHRPSTSASSVTLPSSTRNTEPLPSNPLGLSTSRRHHSGDKTPQLCLRINTTPVSPIVDYVAPSPTQCPPFPPSPITPILPDDIEIRRKRMAKLTRHLGENIPAELVSATKTVPEAPTFPLNRPSRKRSKSVHDVRTAVVPICDSRPFTGQRPSTAQTRQDWVGEWNRPNINDVQRELRSLRVK